jgi:hypothetical protein
MNEQHPLAHVSDRQRAQRSPQLTAWTELAPQRRAAGHVLNFPRFEPRLERQHDAMSALSHQTPQRSLDTRRPSSPFGGRRESEVLTFRAVAFVAQRRHRFVIAEQYRDASATFASLALKTQ